MNLFTRQNFAVVRQIADHTDPVVYYVRAVIRNAYTDAIIDTLDLDSKGSQRYTKQWKIPADPSGEGFYISIITSVYTDSTYTTKSSDYGDEENTYMVIDRPRNFGGGSSFIGGGSNLMGRDVRDIVKEELKSIFPVIEKMIVDNKVEIPVETPQEKEKEDVNILKILDIVTEINKKESPEMEKVDLTPISSDIIALGEKIDAIDVSKDTPTILNAIQEHKESGELSSDDIKTMLSQSESKIIDEIKSSITNALKNKLRFATTFVSQPRFLNDNEVENKKEDSTPNEEKPEEFDLSKLNS